MSISESPVRGRLRRKGYALVKSRSRTEEHHDFGLYRIGDPYTNTVVEGANHFPFELTLVQAA